VVDPNSFIRNRPFFAKSHVICELHY
jgi:hypothetical protein